jgi:(4S)-4-hydroxy-5-phosphonooxypentane-2,3-dione isomerase
MTVTCVYVHVKPEFIQAFMDATSENHHASVKEPGNLRFDLIQQVNDPCRFMIYEAYCSEEAAAAHKTTTHYLVWRERVGEFMAEPRNGVKYSIIEPRGNTV